MWCSVVVIEIKNIKRQSLYGNTPSTSSADQHHQGTWQCGCPCAVELGPPQKHPMCHPKDACVSLSRGHPGCHCHTGGILGIGAGSVQIAESGKQNRHTGSSKDVTGGRPASVRIWLIRASVDWSTSSPSSDSAWGGGKLHSGYYPAKGAGPYYYKDMGAPPFGRFPRPKKD